MTMRSFTDAEMLAMALSFSITINDAETAIIAAKAVPSIQSQIHDRLK